MYRIFLGAMFFMMCAPLPTYGALRINEIAWMGTSVGPNEEWIELHNDGASDVSVEGWVLTDNVSLEIVLAGTVGAGEYAVLERTDDDTISGTAFLIYTGALSNDGRTLSLKRADESLEDQVAGGDGWSTVGGDNTTKHTAQWTVGGWITGNPTPGMSNVTVPSAPQPTSTNKESTKSSGTIRLASPSKPTSTTLQTEDAVLELTLKAPTRAYVNQVIDFDVTPKGAGKTILNSLRYAWNFGDSYTSHTKNPRHAFAYTGEYVVVVDATFAGKEATMRQHIVVLEVPLSLGRTTQGDILIHNDASYEVDISGYHLYGTKYFIFPQNTFIVPLGTLTLSQQRVGAKVSTPVTLFDTDRTLVASTLAETEEVSEYTAPIFESMPPSAPFVSPARDGVEDEEASSPSLREEEYIPIGTQVIMSEPPPKGIREDAWLWIFGIFVFGLTTLLLIRRKNG